MVGESFLELIQNMTLITGMEITMYHLTIGFMLFIVIGLTTGLTMVKFCAFGKTMSSFCCRFTDFS